MPDYDLVLTSHVALQVYDAIIKRSYLRAYGMQPDEVDKTSNVLLHIWDKIDSVEEEKKRLNTTNG